MRIIGGKDYYDSAMAFGRDIDLVFVRNQTPSLEKKLVPLSLPKFDIKFRREGDRYFKDNYRALEGPFMVTVFFAGKRYQGIRYIASGYIDNVDNTFWHREDFDNFMKKRKMVYKFYDNSWRSGSSNLNEKAMDEYFVPVAATNEEMKWMVENRIAIAYYFDHYNHNHDQLWNFNMDGLKRLHFYTAIDPYTAFQELSMYVGGVLPRNPNPMVEITDEKVKVAKHGFDKWSFRKKSVDKVR
jgi:hypothetical protein